MSSILVSEIYVYPIKSTYGIALGASEVLAEGFRHDRRWALADKQDAVLTAREFPEMLGIRTALGNGELTIELPGYPAFSVPYQPDERNHTMVKLFGNAVPANAMPAGVNEAFSNFLQTDCRLIFMDWDCIRTMSRTYGGTEHDRVSYADTAPFLLVSEATLAELNERLLLPARMRSFRPNLVVRGCGAGEEEGWKKIRIGDTVLEQSEPCKRCVMTTMDPETGARNPLQEPLRTMAAYRRHHRGGVRFGINMIPRTLGTIRLGDPVEVLERI